MSCCFNVGYFFSILEVVKIIYTLHNKVKCFLALNILSFWLRMKLKPPIWKVRKMPAHVDRVFAPQSLGPNPTSPPTPQKSNAKFQNSMQTFENPPLCLPKNA